MTEEITAFVAEAIERAGIRTRFAGDMPTAYWTDPWTGRRRWASAGGGSIRDATDTAKATITLDAQRRWEDAQRGRGDRMAWKGGE